MSVLTRLFRGSGAPAPAQIVAPRREPVLSAGGDTSGLTNPKSWLTDIGFGATSGLVRSRVKSLPPVSPQTAQKHATVFACCSVIAGDLSKVPLDVWQRQANGTEVKVAGHPAAFLLNGESAPGVAAAVTRLALIYAFALRGNGYAYAPRDGGGELVMIEAVKDQNPSILKAGRERFYDFVDGEGLPRRVPSRNMVHMRYLADDGWTGRSPIHVAAESIGIALAGQEAAARVTSGQFVRAIIKLADDYQDDETELLTARRIAEALRNPDLEGFPVMRHNEGIEKLDLSASDQQLLESRKFDVTQICAVYRMPPSKVQSLEHGVKANVEQQSIDYLTDCLMHWGTQVEAQMGMALLTPAERAAGLVLRHDFDALLRPTTRERFESYQRAVGGPIMTPNEGRRLEGLPPIQGGDILYPPTNMTRDAGTGSETKETQS